MGTFLAGGTGLFTSDMLTTIVTNLTADLTMLVPVGLTVMGMLISIRLVPKVIKTYIK